jgi:hypothetical protein
MFEVVPPSWLCIARCLEMAPDSQSVTVPNYCFMIRQDSGLTATFDPYRRSERGNQNIILASNPSA